MHTGVSSPTNSLSLRVVASMLDTKENSVRCGREGLDIREMVSRMGLMVGAGEVWRRSFRRLLWHRDVQAAAQTPRSPSPHAYQWWNMLKNRRFSTFYIINDFILLYKFCFDRYRSGFQFKKD